VSNLSANMRLGDRAQVALSHGLKFQEADIAGSVSSGVTQFAASELRLDLTERFDVGFAASALFDHATGTADYAFGPSIGFTPVENAWISLGYTVSGFHDADFEAAEFSRNGAYIKVRVKFDEQTAQSLLDRISPN
jgi:hypothetical protein